METRESGTEGTEERLIEDLLDGFSHQIVPGPVTGDETAARLARELVEVFGLLAYENKAVAPPPPVRERLLATIEQRDSVETGAEREAFARPRSATWGWALPVAATLAVALLGLAGWQQLRLEQQAETIEGLAAQLSHKNVEMVGLSEGYTEQLARMQEQLALVTSKGVEVCELKPQAAEAAATGARGALFIASDHQHWYLRIDDLEPCPQGRSYQLWFVQADGTAVDAGILEVKHGVELEVTSDSMPEETKAVHITLEPAGGSEQPSGPTVLYGDESMQIL